MSSKDTMEQLTNKPVLKGKKDDLYLTEKSVKYLQGDNTMENRELTFGEKSVGLTFNPSNNEAVQLIKQEFAKIIDQLNDSRNAVADGESKRLFSVAITEAQTSQMWAVKAITWKS